MQFSHQILYILVIALFATLHSDSAVIDNKCAEEARSFLDWKLDHCDNDKNDICYWAWMTALNQRTIKCGFVVSFTLCRVNESRPCTSLQQAKSLTEEECSKMASEEYRFDGADSTITVFSPGSSRCVPEYNYDCHKFCSS